MMLVKWQFNKILARKLKYSVNRTSDMFVVENWVTGKEKDNHYEY